MKALELAEAAETMMRPGGLADEVARELRRLAKVNAGLLEALQLIDSLDPHKDSTTEWNAAFKKVAEAIAKAKEQQ